MSGGSIGGVYPFPPRKPPATSNACPLMTRPLNERQRTFAREYAVTGNASEAARRAGYSVKHASKIGSDLLKDDRIRGAVASARSAISGKLEDAAAADADTVMRGLYAEATRTGPGSTHAARVSAWRSIGDALGMFRSTDAPRGVAAVSAVRVELVLPESGGSVLLTEARAAAGDPGADG